MRVKNIAKLKHSAIISTFIKLPFVNNIFEWPLKTGFTVLKKMLHEWQTPCELVPVDPLKGLQKQGSKFSLLVDFSIHGGMIYFSV